MTRNQTAWIVTLIAALVALGSSIAWAATRSDEGRWDMMRYGSGMMGYAARGGGDPVSDLPGARRQAERFADRLDLKVREVMQFSDGFYAELAEDDGRLATEVLIDSRTGATWFEYGPAMMWNTRYGMMRGGGPGAAMGGAMNGWMMGRGGMMGGGCSPPTRPGPLAPPPGRRRSTPPRRGGPRSAGWTPTAAASARVWPRPSRATTPSTWSATGRSTACSR